ncbi:hypothetical protein [Streptomyces chryseus]|uniref:hypothetical protein n=1 Tax=Streptomyces chryseus TaxID=68186 RepID=UPI00110F74E8|nr:hypothetical protein [Streptomyces chryseus]GGX26524.1 hypothetical protein GCM10010353_46940 [Streptomyces chryseus]
MAKTVKGTGRVSVFPLLHVWPDVYGMVAYTTSGSFGDTAIMGYIPIASVPDVSLMDVAARHQPGGGLFGHACWVICTGWSSRMAPKPRTLDVPDAEWALELDRTTELDKTMYGHDRLHVGRFSLADPALMEAAKALLPA